MGNVEEALDLESLLVAEGVVTEEQISRARRINQHLHRSRRTGEILVEMGQLARGEYERVLRLHRSRLSLCRILHENNALSDDGVAKYERLHAQFPDRSERALLVDANLVTEEQFLQALGFKHDIPYVEPEVRLADAALLDKTSLPYLIRHAVLPLRISDGVLTAIVSDPLDLQILNELERIYGVPVKPCCATEARIVEALHTMERLRDGRATEASSLQYRDLQQVSEAEVTGEGAISIVDYLISRAIELRASDLHVEPMQNKVRVRVRVDGSLQTLTDLPVSFAPQVTSRIKVLAGSDIAERRMHQDGRITVRADGREVDIRVSVYASSFGENVVLRLLDRKRGLASLEDLGFEPRVLSMLREVVLRTSSGMVLITGPTGSGKTTTLYSFVDYVNDPTVKVISAEDPVEYVLEGVIQCTVNQKTGPTFAESLKAIVRQDPDVIVVGEVRDQETARLAVESALTGHKVMSTFHTEDSVGAMLRLQEMNIEPFLVSSTLSCIVAQRLVRRVCPSCQRPAEPKREDLRALKLSRGDVAGMKLVEGEGCDACGHTGYKGRMAIYEVLLPDDDCRDGIMRKAPSRELRELARRSFGFLTLQEAGLLRAAGGMTTLAEVVVNAPQDPQARRPAELMQTFGGGASLL